MHKKTKTVIFSGWLQSSGRGGERVLFGVDRVAPHPVNVVVHCNVGEVRLFSHWVRSRYFHTG